MRNQWFGTVCGVVLCCGLVSGCARQFGGYATGPQPMYTSVPAGAVPIGPAPSGPIAIQPTGGNGTTPIVPTPISTPITPTAPSGNPNSAGNNGMDGSGISLQPTVRTGAWLTPYRSGWPTTFASPTSYGTPTAFGTPISYGSPTAYGTPATFGQQYASVGTTIDGRQVAWGGAPSVRAARPLKTSVHPGSRADRMMRRRVGQTAGVSTAARVNGIAATPQEDLKFRGGKTMKDVTFINIYVGGQQSWNDSDRKNIDWALASAMSDAYLNHVIMQYFNDQPVSANFVKSFYLNGYQPQKVTQANVKDLCRLLYSKGAFTGLPLGSTMVNFMLPRDVILEDPDSGQQSTAVSNKLIPHEEESSSLEGLGGYHGSVHIGSDIVYYAVGVYSERRSNGQTNGIPAFDQPWKNVVATFYHELQEARTDPDVDDAITTGQDRYIGWTSDSGEEIGDFPVDEDGNDGKLDQVFVEIPLANGSGTIPVQLIYSNAVHGPEGPIKVPYRGNPLPITAPIPLPGSTPSTPPAQPNNPNPAPAGSNSSSLDFLNQEWGHLPDSVKKQILDLIQAADGHAPSSPF